MLRHSGVERVERVERVRRVLYVQFRAVGVTHG
jgi:hypothetical protein